MKELSLEEVLRIAGGVPAAAALDEVTYRAPAEPHGERARQGEREDDGTEFHDPFDASRTHVGLSIDTDARACRSDLSLELARDDDVKSREKRGRRRGEAALHALTLIMLDM